MASLRVELGPEPVDERHGQGDLRHEDEGGRPAEIVSAMASA